MEVEKKRKPIPPTIATSQNKRIREKRRRGRYFSSIKPYFPSLSQPSYKKRFHSVKLHIQGRKQNITHKSCESLIRRIVLDFKKPNQKDEEERATSVISLETFSMHILSISINIF